MKGTISDSEYIDFLKAKYDQRSSSDYESMDPMFEFEKRKVSLQCAVETASTRNVEEILNIAYEYLEYLNKPIM